MVKQSAKTATAPKKYIPVNVPEEIYQVYRSYSQLTGVPVAKAIRDGLNEYAATCLSARLETLTEQIKAGRGVLQPHAAAVKQPAREAAQRESN
jgi:hypothetical protein